MYKTSRTNTFQIGMDLELRINCIVNYTELSSSLKPMSYVRPLYIYLLKIFIIRCKWCVEFVNVQFKNKWNFPFPISVTIVFSSLFLNETKRNHIDTCYGRHWRGHSFYQGWILTFWANLSDREIQSTILYHLVSRPLTSSEWQWRS